VGVSANGLGVNAVVGFAEAVGTMHHLGGWLCTRDWYPLRVGKKK